MPARLPRTLGEVAPETRPAHPIVIAHRGASGYRPEHTSAAYELAIALGADAVEPDVVPTRDGVLVVRHENEIGGTTDVADRPEFADRRTTRVVDGQELTGWFTEDFTWAELSRLRARERLPRMRPASTRFDGRYPVLRLEDVLRIIDAAPREVAVVLEIKHATYFASVGLNMARLVEREVIRWRARGGTAPLVVESFEQGVLDDLRRRELRAQFVYLHERRGAAADLVAVHGRAAPTWESQRTNAGLDALAACGMHGLSVETSALSRDLVTRAHARGLDVYTWTLRPENRFLPERHRIGSARSRHGDWHASFAAVAATGVDGVFADHPDLPREAWGAPRRA